MRVIINKSDARVFASLILHDALAYAAQNPKAFDTFKKEKKSQKSNAVIANTKNDDKNGKNNPSHTRLFT